jgi:hypothetical protein
MKTRLIIALFTLLLGAGLQTAFPQSTAFTYQGQLTDGGLPANGTYEFQFTLFGSPSGGSPVAGPNSPVPTPTPVSNGLFTVTLDFGAAPFMGADRWLEIGVRTNGSADPFTVLAPRPQLRPVPYALHAYTAGMATTASGVAPNSVGAASLQPGAVNSTNIEDGAIMAGDLSPGLLNDTFWKLLGNDNTLPDTHFLGTTDNRPLLVKVNNLRVMRLEDPGDSGDPDSLPDGAPNVIAGSPANMTGTNVVGATIAGGGATNNLQLDLGGFYTVGGNEVSADFGTIGGGGNNLIHAGAAVATIAGGVRNTIHPGARSSTIAGGVLNTIQTNATLATIGGGLANSAQGIGAVVGGGGYDGDLSAAGNSAHGNASVVAGGVGNDIGANAHHSAIGGGYDNNIGPNATTSTISGGESNSVSTLCDHTVIAGGQGNSILTNGSHSAIGGGQNNLVTNLVAWACIPGGRDNAAGGHYAFAAGRRAKAIHLGTFVWGDSNNAEVASTNANSVTMRASGGYRLYSNSGLTLGAYLAPNGTSWGALSDRNAKKDFAPVDNREVLEKLAAVPITQWHYRWEESNATPHIGPMAQDFKAAFYPGRDNTTITTQEADGVALAAIQGLNQKLTEELKRRDAENAELKQRLESENTELKQAVAELRQLVNKLSAPQNGDAR